MEATCSSLSLSRGTQHPEGIEQCDIKLTQTEHYLARQRTEFVTSPGYIHMYSYEHSWHGHSWQISTCANSVYQALFLLPLLQTWEWGYEYVLLHQKPTHRVAMEMEECGMSYTAVIFLVLGHWHQFCLTDGFISPRLNSQSMLQWTQLLLMPIMSQMGLRTTLEIPSS